LAQLATLPISFSFPVLISFRQPTTCDRCTCCVSCSACREASDGQIWIAESTGDGQESASAIAAFPGATDESNHHHSLLADPQRQHHSRTFVSFTFSLIFRLDLDLAILIDRTTIAPNNVANPDSACFIFQNGSLQPIAYSLAPAIPANSQQPTAPPRTTSATPQTQVSNDIKASKNNNNNEQILKAVNKRDGTGQ